MAPQIVDFIIDQQMLSSFLGTFMVNAHEILRITVTNNESARLFFGGQDRLYEFRLFEAVGKLTDELLSKA